MKIGIDGGALQNGHYQAGLYQYTSHLVAELGALKRDHEYTVLFFNGRGGMSDAAMARWSVGAHVRPRLCPVPYRGVRFLDRLSLPTRALLGQVDVFHGPAFRLAPGRCSRASVVTIHDLAFLTHPEWFPDASGVEHYRRHTAEAVRKADRLVTVSAFTRDALLERYQVDPERVRVIHPGIDREFQPEVDSAASKALRVRYGLSRPYVLFVGYQEAKKNIVRLVEAFAAIRHRLPEPHQLVLVGPYGPDTDVVRRTIDTLRLEREVTLTGAVPREELPTWYANAAVFVFPSLYEGFGIPPLEAMACGTPVVASRAAALAEVAGPGARLVDPLQAEDIGEALVDVLTRPDERRRLVERGVAHARRFSWERMAREMADLYEEVGQA